MFHLLSAHQIHFGLFLKYPSMGSSVMLKDFLFKVLRAEYESPFLEYSRL